MNNNVKISYVNETNSFVSSWKVISSSHKNPFKSLSDLKDALRQYLPFPAYRKDCNINNSSCYTEIQGVLYEINFDCALDNGKYRIQLNSIGTVTIASIPSHLTPIVLKVF